MAQNTLLRLCSSAPGLPGPYLQEYVAPYQVFDLHAGNHYSTILAIGGQQKRECFTPPIWSNDSSVVSLWQQGQDDFVFDCEMHLGQEDLPRIIAGPRRGDYQYHLLQNTGTVLTFAHDIYYNILSRFSDIVVIFVLDIGGISKTLDMLCRWLSWPACKREPARIILCGAELTPQEIRFELMARVTSRLHCNGAQSRTSTTEAKRLIATAFHITTSTCDAVHEQVAGEARKDYDPVYRLSVKHLKVLLRETIAQFAVKPSDIQLEVLSRRRRPIPIHIEDNITEFLDKTQHVQVEAFEIVASALVMDAFPVNMPCK